MRIRHVRHNLPDCSVTAPTSFRQGPAATLASASLARRSDRAKHSVISILHLNKARARGVEDCRGRANGNRKRFCLELERARGCFAGHADQRLRFAAAPGRYNARAHNKRAACKGYGDGADTATLPIRSFWSLLRVSITL